MGGARLAIRQKQVSDGRPQAEPLAGAGRPWTRIVGRTPPPSRKGSSSGIATAAEVASPNCCKCPGAVETTA